MILRPTEGADVVGIENDDPELGSWAEVVVGEISLCGYLEQVDQAGAGEVVEAVVPDHVVNGAIELVKLVDNSLHCL